MVAGSGTGFGVPPPLEPCPPVAKAGALAAAVSSAAQTRLESFIVNPLSTLFLQKYPLR